jgi:hypothetical protein
MTVAPVSTRARTLVRGVLVVALLLLTVSIGARLFRQQHLLQTRQQTYRQATHKVAQLLLSELRPLLWLASFDHFYSTRTLQKIRETVFRFESGGASYLFMLDHKGVFLHHPERELALGSARVSDFFPAATARAVLERLPREQPTFLRFTDRNHHFWILLEPLAGTRFTLGMLCSESTLAREPAAPGFLLLICLSASLALVCGLILRARLWELNRRNLKRLSWLSSGWLVLNMSLAWFVQINGESTPGERYALQSPADLTRYRALLQSGNRTAAGADPVLIPAGLEIRTFNFEKPDLIRISGYYWQKFPLRLAANIAAEAKGLRFPEARSVQISDTFVRRTATQEITGARFEVVLQQPFNPTRYPLNRESISLRFSVPENGHGLALIPDPEIYLGGATHALAPGLHTEGWNIYASSFSYAPAVATPVSEQIIPVAQRPELALNIYVRRSFWGVIILNLLYVGMVLLLLFWVLIRTTPAYRADYKALDIFGPGIGLLFPLLFAHSNLHLGITGVERLFYLDSFYFVVYVMIVLVIAQFLFLPRSEDSLWARWDGILLKALYWPFVLGFLECVTFCLFSEFNLS